MHLIGLWLGLATCYFGLGCCHHTFNEQAILSRSKSGFEESRLVPDLLSVFNPQGILAIHFAGEKILRHPGFSMSAQDTQAGPTFQLYPGYTGQLNPADTFTLIMLDPDSPIHANPSGAKLHLLATGLALDRRHEPVETYNLVNNTQFLVDWLSPDPEPRTGVHRYTFLLYRGVASQASVQPFQASTFNRSGFNLAQFTRDAGLQDSYAGAFMNMDSAPPENLIRQNAQVSSASGRSIDMYTFSITIILSFFGAIYLSYLS